MSRPITMVIGGQYGSEAKGAVAAYLCQRLGINYAVRTGAVNAGHTVYHNGKPFKMQQLPTGWVNRSTQLVLGPGAYIHPEILAREMGMIDDNTGWSADKVDRRLLIDYRAGLHLNVHTNRSTESGRHHKIGATGKGCSEAIIDRIRKRGSDETVLFKDYVEAMGLQDRYKLVDTEKLLNNAYDDDYTILLEATQGQQLDILLGPYPYTTHKPTGPGQWLVEAGLSPNLKYDICMVVRTFPIRVAGNSGPMTNEISWSDLAQRINRYLGGIAMMPMISATALQEWEATQITVAKELDETDNVLPLHGHRLHLWTDKQRHDHSYAASEFHRMVFERLSPPVLAELGRLFEFTTVTKKLRRIAEMDVSAIHNSIRQIRPNYIVLTFLNYLYPDLWNKTNIPFGHPAISYVRRLESELGVEIRYVSTGPESCYIIAAAGR